MTENENKDAIEKIDIIVDGLLNIFSPPFHVSETSLKISWLTYQQTFKDYKIDPDSIKLYVEVMVDEGLICLEKDSTDKYILTALGRKIKRHGGWLNHLEQEKQDKIKQRENVDASIRTNNSVMWNIWLTLGVAAFTAAVTYAQYSISSQQDKSKYQKMKELSKSHYCCCHCMVKTQKEKPTSDTTHVINIKTNP